MYLYIFGFLLDSSDDDSLQFEMKIDPSANDKVMSLLRHETLNAMAGGDWLLSSEQVTTLSSIIKQPLPTGLKLLIGVVA